MKYFKKAERIFHPPSRDSGWQDKPEFSASRLILGVLKAIHVAKEGNLNVSFELLKTIAETPIPLKNATVLLRKVNWGLGTLYNQYKEREKAINCFINGLAFSDRDNEFAKALHKLEGEDFFLIFYVYFKYKTAKLLKMEGRFEDGSNFAKEAKYNLGEVNKKLDINSNKNIFTQELMSILGFIGKKLARLCEDIEKKREVLVIKKNTENVNNDKYEEKKKSKFNQYLLNIKERRIASSSSIITEQKVSKDELLFKLRQVKESTGENEYMLKNIYKSGKIAPKVDQNYLKSLSLNKSKEIEKTYLFSQNPTKTTRSTAQMTYSSNFLVQSERNLSKSRVYEILPRPGFETSRKSRESSQQREKTEIDNSVNAKKENSDKKMQSLLKKIVNLGENAEKRGYLVKQNPPSNPTLMHIVEEKSSGFLTEKNCPVRINVIESSTINLLPPHLRESLKQEVIQGMLKKEPIPNPPKPKPKSKKKEIEEFNIFEEYDKVEMSIPKSVKPSPRRSEVPINNFLKQPSREEPISGISSAHSRKGGLSLMRKESSEDDRRSIASGKQINSSNFLSSFKNKPIEYEAEVSNEQKVKLIKAGNFIISRFRKYKKRKNMEASQIDAVQTSVSQDISDFNEPLVLPPPYQYAKSASIRKSEVLMTKSHSNFNLLENQRTFERKVALIIVDCPQKESHSMKKSTSIPISRFAPQMEPGKGKNLNRYLRTFAQQFKDKRLTKNLDIIPRPCFFMMKFIQGKLFKFKVRIKKFLEKSVVLCLSSQGPWSLEILLTIPLKLERKSGAFLEYKTVWPVVFDALFAYLKERKLVKEEEFYSELDGLLKRSPKGGFLENSNYLKSGRLTAMDVEVMGQIKMLLDILFDKAFELEKKQVGVSMRDSLRDTQFTSKGLFLRRLRSKVSNLWRQTKIKKTKEARKIQSLREELVIQEIKTEIGDFPKVYKLELWQETFNNLNRNNVLVQFLVKDIFWRRFWLIKVSWSWDRESVGPIVRVSGFDWRQDKKEKSYKLFDWERFKKKLGNDQMDSKNLLKECLIFSGLRKSSRRVLLEVFHRSFYINNKFLIVASEEEKKKHSKLREFFKKNEVFGVDLLNTKPMSTLPLRNENLFKREFDNIYSQFFEDKREFLEDEKEKDLNKIIQTEDFQDFAISEKYPSNKILIEDEEKTRRRSLRYFRIEKANTFYAYLKNFIKERKLGKLYFRLRRNTRILNAKILFLFDDDSDSVNIQVKSFDVFRKTNFFIEIVDFKSIILMTNILLVNNEKIKRKQLARIIKPVLQFNGIKLSCKNEGLPGRKPIFNEYFLKTSVMNDFIEKNSNFISSSLVFIQNLVNIGKSIVFVNIYENKHKGTENRILFSLRLLDFTSKVKRYKLIIALEDIISLFPWTTGIFQDSVDLHSLKLLFMKILNKFTLENFSLYPSLVLTPSKQKSLMTSHRFDKIRRVKNCFNEKRGIPIFPKRNNGFLEEFVQESRVVMKVVKKYQGNFYILIISKSLLMNYWIIKTYISRSSRTFIAYANNTDLMKFSIEDLENALNKNLQILIEHPNVIKNFTDFQRKLGKGQDKIEASIRAPPQLPTKLKENLRILQTKLKKTIIMNKFTSTRMRKMQKIKGLNDLTKKMDNFSGTLNEKRLLKFCEFEIWYRLFEKIEIITEKTQRFEFRRGDFSLILKEVLFSRYVKIDNNNEAFIEIFLFFLNENPSVFFTLDSINYAYSMNFNFVIKYLSLNRMNIQIDNINFRELINIYISDGFYKHPTNYMHSKLLMSDVKDLCHFLIYKIKSANFCNFLHNQNELNIKKRRKMHANDNISYMRNIAKEVKFGDQIYHITDFIARAKPYCVINALVSENEKKIIINVYNSRRSDIFTKEVPFSSLRTQIRFFSELLREKEWKIMVERLWMVIEKDVMIEAEFNFRFNEN